MRDHKLASLSSELDALQTELDVLQKKGEDGTATHKDLAELYEVSVRLSKLMKDVEKLTNNLAKEY